MRADALGAHAAGDGRPRDRRSASRTLAQKAGSAISTCWSTSTSASRSSSPGGGVEHEVVAAARRCRRPRTRTPACRLGGRVDARLRVARVRLGVDDGGAERDHRGRRAARSRPRSGAVMRQEMLAARLGERALEPRMCASSSSVFEWDDRRARVALGLGAQRALPPGARPRADARRCARPTSPPPRCAPRPRLRVGDHLAAGGGGSPGSRR